MPSYCLILLYTDVDKQYYIAYAIKKVPSQYLGKLFIYFIPILKGEAGLEVKLERHLASW